MKKNTRIFFVIIFLVTSLTAISQGHLKKGWKYFNENELDDARDEFYDATKSSKTAQEAYLSYALVNTVDKDDDNCFDKFKSFIEIEKNINPYLYNYWFGDMFVNKEKLDKNRISFINELLTSGKLNFTNTAFAYRSLADHYQRIRKFSKAEEYRAKLGNIIEWQMVGNFENISGSGFDKDFGPLEHPENSYEFTNRNGAPIKWFTAKHYKPGVWINASYHSYTENSITFAQTFIQSPKDQEVILYVGVHGSLKVWLNDKLILSEEEERSLGFDAYSVKVKLKRGYNRLLLQVGQSDDVSSSKFFVRFSDLNNNLITFSVSSKPKSYPKNYNYQPTVYKHFAEKYFENLEKNDKEKILYKILLQDVYQKLDKPYEARKVLFEARNIAPKSSFIAGKLMLVYKREDAETLLSKLLEEVKKTDPNNPIALSLMYNDAIEKEDWDEADEVLTNLEEVVGNNEDVYQKRIDLLLKKEENSKAIKLVFEAHKKYPDNINFMIYQYLIYTSAFNNNKAGLSTLKSFYKKNFSTTIAKIIAQHYYATGNTSAFQKEMDKLIAMEPYVPKPYEIVAEKFANRQYYSKAIEYYEKLIDNVPYVGYYYALIADAYKENDDESEAEEAYQKCLLYSPNDYKARKEYRKFIGEKDVFEYFEEPDVYEIYKKSASADDYPEDNSLIVLNQTQKVVYQGGGSEEKTYIIIKVFNKTGIDTWKEYYIDSKGQDLTLEKAEVLKKNGETLKAERDEEEEPNRLIFTNLEEGDAILVVYKLQSYKFGTLLKHFWDMEYFDHFYPTSKQVYSILVEGDQKFNYEMTASDLKPEIEEPDDNFKKYTWTLKDVKSIKDESYMPAIVDFARVLHYSSIPDWNFISQWYYDISTTKAKSNFEVKDVLNQILKGKENASEYEKAHLIYDYVVKEIRYSSIPFRQSGIVPQKASKTINTKIGDCKDVATLFIALCREAGLKAQIMLVNTRDNGKKEMMLPSIGFNHAISKVWIDGKPYVVELTSDYLPFSTMGARLKKSFVLDIKNNPDVKPFLLDMPTRQPNKIVRTADITFDSEGNMQIKRTATRWGDYAAGIRANYRDIGEKKRIKELTNAISGDFAKIKINSFHFDSTLYTTDDSVYYTYDFMVYEPFIGFENKNLLKLPLAMKQEPMDFLNDNRKYPLDVWKFANDDSREETIVIHTPKNMALSSIPKSKHYVSKFGEYWLTFKRKGRDLVVTRKIVFAKDVVAVNEFQEFATFYKNIIKADETQLGYKVYR